jgi:hypothetical protein
MPIDAVVFDIGRVLIDWQPEAFYDRTIGPDRRKALFSEVDLHGMNLGVDLGDDLEEAVEGLAVAHPGWAAEIRLWQSHWLAMASPEIPGSVHLLRQLKARGVPLFALTNFGAAWSNPIRRSTRWSSGTRVRGPPACSLPTTSPRMSRPPRPVGGTPTFSTGPRGGRHGWSRKGC